MSDDGGQDEPQQISVAELLARNGQKVASRDGGRRRGRPGGISVAELTGDIPIIRDSDTGSIHAIEAEPEVGAEDVRPVASTPAEPRPEQQRPAETRSEEARPAETQPAETRPAETQAAEARAAEAQVAPPEPVAAEPVGGRRRRPEPPTPEPAVSADTRESDESDEHPVEAWSSVEREPQLLSGGTVAGDLFRTRVRDAEKAAANEREDESAEADEPAADAAPSSRRQRKAEKESHDRTAARQWVSLGGQAVVAVVAGALMFKGFERLWDMMPWVALALSFLVIIGLVAVVRVLRKTDDMVSLVIAIVVGLFVTLGPLAFMLSTN